MNCPECEHLSREINRLLVDWQSMANKVDEFARNPAAKKEFDYALTQCQLFRAELKGLRLAFNAHHQRHGHYPSGQLSESRPNDVSPKALPL